MTLNKQPRPRILVVMPTLGQRTDLLLKTLKSLEDQAPVEFDLVMIFPFKNTETKKIATEHNAIMIDDPGSLSAALNVGIEQARGYHEFISWMGDDDLYAKNSLKTAMDALDSNPDSVIAFGYCDYIDNDDNFLFSSRAGSLAPWIMSWGPNLVPLPGILFRKKSLDVAGKFDENNKYSMDLDMLLRLKKIGKFINTKRKLASFRWHPSSTTVASRTASLKEAQAVKRKYLPKFIKPFAPIWEIPVKVATKIAARKVNSLAKH